MEKVFRIARAASLVVALVFTQEVATYAQKLQTVGHVDVSRYAGKWYEIAAYPKRFERGCQGTTAEYTVCDNGTLLVQNSCTRDGKPHVAYGRAKVKKNTGNARLKVQFQWPFSGKYWIISLADDYSYAVVSHPNKKSLWILSRTPQMDDALYSKLQEQLTVRGFDVSKLKRTPQTYAGVNQ